jgi:tripartite-type tricarboxylate transporter receptor subunit TctC
MRLLKVTAICLAASATAAVAAGNDYPNRMIRLIVPQAAGSASDNGGRLLAAVLSQDLGQQVIVENRPGAAFSIGLDYVAKSTPDGYTLGTGPIGALAMTPHVVAKLPYDIQRDFTPIALVTRGQMLLAVSPRLPVNSVKELIAYAKDHPGKLSNASAGNGSPGHVGGELFKAMTGTDIVHVPYRGGSLALNDLIAGHVSVIFESLQSIAPLAREGKIKALAVTGDHRSPSFPDLPTIAEAGVPGYAAETWTGLLGPAGMPRPIVDKLNAAVNKAMTSQAFKDKFIKFGDEPGGGTPEEFAAAIKNDSAKWGDLVKRAGIKIE